MDIREALKKRKSTRAFLDRDVSRDKVVSVLEAARHSPSGVNTQPWQVAVVRGSSKKKLQERIETAFRSGEKPGMDFQYYPLKWVEPYKTRRFECGLQLYAALGIKRQEKDRRLEQWVANYRAFDAPVMLLFFMDPGLETGSYMDYGMFMQSIMLAALSEGLATCPQAALGEFPEIVKNELDYPADSILLGGMALGYEDPKALVNSYRTQRLEVESFTRFFE